jgi:hypothetical protein
MIRSVEKRNELEKLYGKIPFSCPGDLFLVTAKRGGSTTGTVVVFSENIIFYARYKYYSSVLGPN